MSSEIKVDTISENTSANGVVIDSVTLKDGGITTTDSIGIGTSSPAKLLSLKKDGGGNAIGIDIHNQGTDNADDALITFETQGHRNFSLGIDRSASAFVITSEADGLGTPRITVDDDGDVLIGTTSQINSDRDHKLGVFTDGNSTPISTKVNTNLARFAIDFNNTNGRVGTINTDGSATSFNTSSDYRLKENVETDWDGTSRLKQLKPSRFNFISDPDRTVDGFLAHEVSDIVPEAISGEKDAMLPETYYEEEDEIPEGKKVGDVKDPERINPQGIDQSKLVPLMVKTIQELEARIKALEDA